MLLDDRDRSTNAGLYPLGLALYEDWRHASQSLMIPPLSSSSTFHPLDYSIVWARSNLYLTYLVIAVNHGLTH